MENLSIGAIKMSLCNFCKGDSIRDLIVSNEIYCRYECYNKMYDLEDDE
jgi:hypothetical protein